MERLEVCGGDWMQQVRERVDVSKISNWSGQEGACALLERGKLETKLCLPLIHVLRSRPLPRLCLEVETFKR